MGTVARQTPLLDYLAAAEMLGITVDALEVARQRGEIAAEPYRRQWWQLSPSWGFRPEEVRAYHDRRTVRRGTAPTSEISIDEALPRSEWIRTILQQALDSGASDIHLEPVQIRKREIHLRVRFRIDGILHDQGDYSGENLDRWLSQRLLTMAEGINPAPKIFVPQLGVIQFRGHGHEIWTRLATIRSLHGTTIVLHLIPSTVPESFAALGMDETTSQSSQAFDLLASHAPGLVLFAAPRGEGLTTTLRTALREASLREDYTCFFDEVADFPAGKLTRVVYDREHGLTPGAAAAMAEQQGASLLVFGDISDREIAVAAIEAAERGRVVWAGVRVPGFPMSDAPESAVSILKTRMQAWGIASERLERVLNGAILQRLHRRLCPDCREAIVPGNRERRLLERYGVALPETMYQRAGCGFCRSTGYRDRSGLFLIYKPGTQYYDRPVSFARYAVTRFAVGEIDTAELNRLQIVS